MAQNQPSEYLPDSIQTAYSIDGEIVKKETFQQFISELEEIPGTYHCAKAIGGGRNSYEATDPNGITWVVSSVLKSKNSSVSIEKK